MPSRAGVGVSVGKRIHAVQGHGLAPGGVRVFSWVHSELSFGLPCAKYCASADTTMVRNAENGPCAVLVELFINAKGGRHQELIKSDPVQETHKIPYECHEW